MDNRIGTFDGQQIIQNDGAKAKVLLVNGIVYIEANAKGVADVFDLATPNPQQLAGRWYSVTSNEAGYSTYAAAVTLRSDFSQLQVSGPLRAGSPTKVDGHSVISIHGFVPGATATSKEPATLYVTATGKTLPIEVVVTSKVARETIEWSDWGRSVSLVVPYSIPLPQPETSV